MNGVLRFVAFSCAGGDAARSTNYSHLLEEHILRSGSFSISCLFCFERKPGKQF